MTKKISFSDKLIEFYLTVFVVTLIYLYLHHEYFAMGVLVVTMPWPVVAYILYKKRKKRSFFESNNSLEKIRALTPMQFEDFICHLFDKLGYVTERVGGSSDGGIDVIATKNGVKHYIQCKKFITSQVSVGAMRDFYGAVTDKLTDAKSFFITTNIFTLEAEQFAEGKSIELIDGKKLMDYVKLAGIDAPASDQTSSSGDTAEKCPNCGNDLILRTARKGTHAGKTFLGCTNYPHCRFVKK